MKPIIYYFLNSLQRQVAKFKKLSYFIHQNKNYQRKVA